MSRSLSVTSGTRQNRARKAVWFDVCSFAVVEVADCGSPVGTAGTLAEPARLADLDPRRGRRIAIVQRGERSSTEEVALGHEREC
jgi:hypothetical protein